MEKMKKLAQYKVEYSDDPASISQGFSLFSLFFSIPERGVTSFQFSFWISYFGFFCFISKESSTKIKYD
jgi:hypothetical protein